MTIKENINNFPWRAIAFAAIGILISAFPAYMLLIQKPSKKEVSNLIQKEAPLSIKNELKEIHLMQKTVEIEMVRQSVQLDQILEIVKK